MSDRLDDAFRALREESSGARDDQAARTRAQVLLEASRRTRRRARARVVMLPLAAALIVGAAWAAQRGMFAPALAPSGIAKRVAPAPTLSGIAAGVAPAPAPTPSGIAEGVAPAPAPTPTPSGIAEPVAPTPAPSGSAVTAAAAARDAEGRLYQAAHDAHFVDRDPTRAIAAWDAYLARYPEGRFAPEAHYNRALMLIRAGRRDEGREALRPFADGRYGDYRRTESRALLEALGDR